MDNNYKIYWIKTTNFTDPFIDGYIGLTSQSIEQRFKNHKYNTKNPHLRNRCNGDGVIIVCLHDNLSSKQASTIEEMYRPTENIGWNINRGGDIPPSRKGKVSPKSILVGNERTEKQKQGSKNRSEKIKGNNFSGMRKNRIVHNKVCLFCNKDFIAKSKRQIYCCMSCSAYSRASKFIAGQ